MRKYTSDFSGTVSKIMEELSLKKKRQKKTLVKTTVVFGKFREFNLCVEISFIHDVLLFKAERPYSRGTGLEQAMIPQPFILLL